MYQHSDSRLGRIFAPPRLRGSFSLPFVFLSLLFINKTLDRLAQHIAIKRPEIFDRLDGHHHKLFSLNPVNLPLVFCLYPDPQNVRLKAYRRHRAPAADSTISGSFLTLLGMIDGKLDGDALFFTRDLHVEGDTEAIVCLRNALDDVDGSIADDVAAYFGLAGQSFLKVARRVNTHASHT